MTKKRVPLVLTIALIIIMTSTTFPLSRITLANAETAVSPVSPIVLTNNNSATEQLSPNNSYQTNSELPQISDHKITSSELKTLKSELGVYEEGKNYTQIIDGHGTGLTPPTEQDWNTIASSLDSINSVNYGASAPSSVDQSATPWFPPIGNQGSQGSCVAWSIGYYVKTFQEAKEHNWNVSAAQWMTDTWPGYPSQDYQSEIMSPAFVYNLQNNGVDNGLSFDGAINLVSNIGICSWQKMPYSYYDYSTWPSQDAWTEATLYRSASNTLAVIQLYNNGQGLTTLKNWLASGNLATIAVDATKFSNLNSADLWTLDNYVSPSTNHAGTIVGYDDNFAYVENGVTQHGAFKIANSWGVSGWEPVSTGFYWISYAAMEQRVGNCIVFSDLVGYRPQLEATFSISCADRGDCKVAVGIGNPNSPIAIKYFSARDTSAYVYGGSWSFSLNPITMDITEFENYVSTPFNQPYFLYVYDGSPYPATINSFSVNYAQSSNVPSQLTSGQSTYLNINLPTFNTTWNNPLLINNDQDSVDQKIASASDSYGNMYVAYSDLYPSTGKTAVYVRESTDGGQTWPLVTTAASPTHNLANPSMAINTYNNEVYIAAELEVSASEHQIWVLRYVNGQWSWNAVASVSGQDYRFPSITSESQYGTANRQYISFEYVNNNDDRDLMFAKTTDHGATWAVSKLHGASPDNNVYSQTSITNAGGNLFIAYRFGADYNSVSEIRVDRSSDFGATWTQTTGVSGLPNDCQFPSIAATTSGNSVIVAFQYQANINNVDIMYSYSTDNGASWIKQQPLFASSTVDEKNVNLVTTGTGSIYAICKAGIYAEYTSTPNLQPPGWSPTKTISDGWIGDGLAIGAFPNNNCPYAVWTDSRTKNISFSMNAAPLAFYIYASANTVDQGQSSSLSSTTLTTGTPPYHYQWLQKTPGSGSFTSINGATSPTYSFLTSSSTTTGTWSFELQITDSANIPVTLTSNILNVQVNLPPTVSVTPSSPTIDVDQSIPFVASASGGSGIFSSYQWYLNGSPLSGQTSSTFNYSPSSQGSASVTVSVTDSVSVTSPQSTAASVTVNPMLIPPSVSASLSSVIQGQSSTLTITGLTGGTSPYSYQWLMKTPGASTYILIGGATSSTYTFSTSTSTTLGVWSFKLQVSDSASVPNWVNSSMVSVQVNVPPPVNVGFGVSGVGSDVGSTIILTVDGVFYSYAQLQSLSFSWVPGTQHSVTASASLFGGVGKQYMFVSWTNGNGLSGSSGTFTTPGSGVTVTVNYTAQFVVSFAVSPSWAGSVSPSGSAVWENAGVLTVSAYAGSGYYFSYWSSSSGSITFANANSASTSVTIGGMGTVKANFVTSPPAPSVSVSPGSWLMDLGQAKVFTATASGGSGVYVSYQWYVNGSALSGQTSSTFNYAPSSFGNFSITVTVTDSLGATSVQSAAAGVKVASALILPSAYAIPSVINQGQSSVVSMSGFGGGTSPFMCQWLVKAPGDSGYSLIGGATSFAYTFSTSSSTAVGVWSFELQVTDGAFVPVTATSNAVSVQVSSSPPAPSVSVSPGSWLMDLGQAKVFTATASGGSGVYVSYQWYVNGSALSGQTSSTFNYAPSSFGNFSITVTVTDSLGATSVQSAAAGVKVASALILPSAYAIPSVINQGQSSVVSMSGFGGGTSPFMCQWLVKAPGDSGYSLIGGATSFAYTFSTSSSTAVGVWSFELQVTDGAFVPVTATSNAVSVQVSSSAPSSVYVGFGLSGVNGDVGSSIILTIDGVSYSYAQLQSLSFTWVPGSQHSVTASASLFGGVGKQYAFVNWINGNGLSGNSGTFTVPYSATTVTANYTAQFVVSFVASPSWAGSVSPSGSAVWYNTGTIAVSASAGSGYYFSYWSSSSGAITFANPYSASTFVTIGGMGTITANFVSSPPASVTVGFVLNGVGSDVGSGTVLAIDGTSYSYAQLQSLSFTWVPGSQHQVVASTPISSGVGKQYAFYSWTNGNGLSGSSGTFTVPAYSTTVKATYTTQFLVSFVASPSWAGSVTPSGTIWRDTGMYSISASPIGGYYLSYWSSSSGSITFSNQNAASTYVTIAGPGTVTANFSPIPLVPLVTLSPSSWSMDIGQSKVFAATASGGSGVYVSYQWYVNGSLQIGQTSSTFNYAPVSPFFGSYLITVTVTDSLGVTSAQSPPALVMVSSALVVTSAYATQSSVIQGQSSTLSFVGFGGGIAPYYYQWLVKAPGAGAYSLIGGATGGTYLFTTSTSTAVGIWSFELQITDSASVPTTATSNTVSVQVSATPPPFVSIGFGLNGVGSDVGSTLILTVDGVSYSYAQLQSLSFTWVPGSQHTVAAADSLFGGVGKQYAFVNWINGNGLSGNSGTFTVPYSATTVTANYTAQFVVSFVASPSWAGSVSPSYSAVWENAGALSVSASAGSGYSFFYWSSSSSSITFANPYSASTFVTIGGMGTIKANFVYVGSQTELGAFNTQTEESANIASDSTILNSNIKDSYSNSMSITFYPVRWATTSNSQFNSVTDSTFVNDSLIIGNIVSLQYDSIAISRIGNVEGFRHLFTKTRIA